MAMKAMKSATKTMATKAMKAIQAKTATKTATKTMAHYRLALSLSNTT